MSKMSVILVRIGLAPYPSLNVSSIIECDIPGTTDILVPHYSVWEFLSLRKFYFRTNSPQPAIESAFRKRSEEHTSELQSLMRISYAVFCLKKKTKKNNTTIRS